MYSPESSTDVLANEKVCSFADDNSMVAVITQSIVQDIWWIYEAAVAIRTARAPAYFIPAGPQHIDPKDANVFYAVVSLPPGLKTRHKDAWMRLTDKNRPFKLDLFAREDDGEVADTWNCRAVEHPEMVPELGNNHPIHEHEVALHVRRSRGGSNKEPYEVKVFGSRTGADKAGIAR